VSSAARRSPGIGDGHDVPTEAAQDALATVPFETPGDPITPGVDFAAAAFVGPPSGVRSRFTFGERVHWRARFGGAVRTVRLHVVTVIAGDDGWERVVSGHELWLAHPDATAYAGWLDETAYRTPGRFVLRFVRDAHVVAEGEFEVVAPRPTPPETDVIH
jgi:hypothetical protein